MQQAVRDALIGFMAQAEAIKAAQGAGIEIEHAKRWRALRSRWHNRTAALELADCRPILLGSPDAEMRL